MRWWNRCSASNSRNQSRYLHDYSKRNCGSTPALAPLDAHSPVGASCTQLPMQYSPWSSDCFRGKFCCKVKLEWGNGRKVEVTSAADQIRRHLDGSTTDPSMRICINAEAK